MNRIARIAVAFALAVTAASAQDEGPPAEAAARPSDTTTALLDLLASPDPDIRAMAREEIGRRGRAAVPAILRRFRERGDDELVRALLEIYRRDPDPALRPQWVDDAWISSLRESLNDPSEIAADAYVRSRFREAVEHLREGNFELARRVVNALLLLEPNHPLAHDLQRFLAGVDQRVLRQNVAEPTAAASPAAAAQGDPVIVTFALDSRCDVPATLEYGLGTGQLILEIEAHYVDALGTEEIETRSATVAIPDVISLDPRGRWTAEWTLDSASDRPDQAVARVYTIRAWSQPGRIMAGPESLIGRLVFPPVDVKVVPAESRDLLESPALGFRRMIESGTVSRLFHAAVLLEGEERTEAAGIVIRLFPELDAGGQTVGYYLLHYLTGQPFGADYEAWRRWWESLRR